MFDDDDLFAPSDIMLGSIPKSNGIINAQQPYWIAFVLLSVYWPLYFFKCFVKISLFRFIRLLSVFLIGMVNGWVIPEPIKVCHFNQKLLFWMLIILRYISQNGTFWFIRNDTFWWDIDALPWPTDKTLS